MSKQGTGISVSFEHELLKAWGQWARSGSLGLGYGANVLAKSSILGSMFSEDDLLRSDRTIAGMPPAYKKILKQFYLHQRGPIDEQTYTQALAEFMERYVQTHL